MAYCKDTLKTVLQADQICKFYSFHRAAIVDRQSDSHIQVSKKRSLLSDRVQRLVERSETSTMELFADIISGCKLLTIFARKLHCKCLIGFQIRLCNAIQYVFLPK